MSSIQTEQARFLAKAGIAKKWTCFPHYWQHGLALSFGRVMDMILSDCLPFHPEDLIQDE